MCVQKYLPPKVSNWICSQVTNRIMSELAENTSKFSSWKRAPNPATLTVKCFSWNAVQPGYESIAEASLSYKCQMKGAALKN